MYTHEQRTTQKMLTVFGSSVIAGAEKAMCLQWQVQSGVSSVPTTRHQNNITLSSSVYAHTHTRTRTRAFFSNIQKQPNKNRCTSSRFLTISECLLLQAALTFSFYPCCWHSDAGLQCWSESVNMCYLTWFSNPPPNRDYTQFGHHMALLNRHLYSFNFVLCLNGI